jgi:protein-S-isoprenylcysteine O-methyltransferase Ste14
MLMYQHMRQSGDLLFRWRSYILLSFLPFFLHAIFRPEPLEHILGEPYEDIYEVLCLLAVAGGLALRAVTVGFVPAGTSGRNTTGQIANELNTTGMYALTRNPLYLGNCITYAGIFLFTQDLLLSFALVLFLVVYYERIIIAEEAFLAERFGAEYTRWASKTPVFFPRLGGWRRPALGFSVRSVLRREYSGWFAAIACLFIIEATREYFGEAVPEIDYGWLAALSAGAFVYLTLRTIKKKTRLLTVDGR